jgi:hypothetical protein
MKPPAVSIRIHHVRYDFGWTHGDHVLIPLTGGRVARVETP